MGFGLWALVFERAAVVEWQGNPTIAKGQRPEAKCQEEREGFNGNFTKRHSLRG